MFRHIWPNATAPIIVQASLSVSSAIIVEASLSFLGVGVLPPTPCWGSILNDGYKVLELAPWMAISAGAAIFITVLGLNFLGRRPADRARPADVSAGQLTRYPLA